MEYKELISSAIQSLRRNVMRTGLTMLGIIIGISSVIMIASLGQSAVAFITNELSSFGTNYFQINPGINTFSGFAGGAPAPLTLEDVQAIESSGIPNIISVAPIGFASRTVSANNENTTATIYGLTPQGQELLKPEYLYGEGMTEDDLSNRVAILGKKVSEELFGVDSNPVGESVRIGTLRFRVIGVSTSGSALAGGFLNSAVTIPIDIMQNEIRGDEELREIDVSVANTALIDDTMAEVEAFLRDYRDIDDGEDADFNMSSFEDQLATVQTITGLLTVFIAGISAISLIVGGVGVMNIMLVSVTERTKEIGLLKSIGAKERDILTQFMIESVVMSVLGGVIGIIAGVSLSILIALAAGLPVVVSIPWILIAVIVSSLVGVVFGLYPARRAAKLSPIDALRYE